MSCLFVPMKYKWTFDFICNTVFALNNNKCTAFSHHYNCTRCHWISFDTLAMRFKSIFSKVQFGTVTHIWVYTLYNNIQLTTICFKIFFIWKTAIKNWPIYGLLLYRTTFKLHNFLFFFFFLRCKKFVYFCSKVWLTTCRSPCVAVRIRLNATYFMFVSDSTNKTVISLGHILTKLLKYIPCVLCHSL